MQSIFRTAVRAPRARLFFPSTYQPISQRFASDYGGKQSGQEQDIDAGNPKADMEHPGPETPAQQSRREDGKASESSSKESAGQGNSGGSSAATHEGASSSSQGGSSSTSQGGNSSTSHGGKPAIFAPPSAAEKDDPEVRKHNEDMNNRHERSVNQLGEEDNKVDKNYWKGKPFAHLAFSLTNLQVMLVTTRAARKQRNKTTPVHTNATHEALYNAGV